MAAAVKSSSLMLRLAARRTFASAPARRLPLAAARKFHSVPPPRQDKPGSHSRTDAEVEFEYPPEHELPSSEPVSGTGGQYVKPTLAGFSLDGNVGVVTGGARGLGLVIGQGMVFSGADLALVDMNSEIPRASSGSLVPQARQLTQRQRRRPRSRRNCSWMPFSRRTPTQNGE
jgi:hypothetical protein